MKSKLSDFEKLTSALEVLFELILEELGIKKLLTKLETFLEKMKVLLDKTI